MAEEREEQTDCKDETPKTTAGEIGGRTAPVWEERIGDFLHSSSFPPSSFCLGTSAVLSSICVSSVFRLLRRSSPPSFVSSVFVSSVSVLSSPPTTGTCSVIKVGKLSMEINEITENVMATLNGVVELLSNKWKYVSSLYLKLSKSLALPIYQYVPDLKLKIDAFATGKSVVKEEKEGEVEEVAAVDGGEESVSVKGKKKKKGRIHEVRYNNKIVEMLDDDENGGDEDNNEIVEYEDMEEKKIINYVGCESERYRKRCGSYGILCIWD
ncbi:Ribosomal protein L1-like [Arabidopsis suecica]|uniref:Ribosomal protein L1-like n=1 Tax=Arabidopsis suecica TaxID=45249 RepID=A0A8T2CPF5_ARASU|nr:Ribosomal protein L1-like [Arabidopsis suecica]